MRSWHRISRRAFLALAAGAGSVARARSRDVAGEGHRVAQPSSSTRFEGADSQRAGTEPIRLLAAIQGDRDDLRAGIRLGAHEMHQTLRLLGRGLDLTWATAEQLPDPRETFASARVIGYTAVIVALDVRPDTDVLSRAGLPVLALMPIDLAELPAADRGEPAPAPTAPRPGPPAAAGVPPSQADATGPSQPPAASEQRAPGTNAAARLWLFRLRAEEGRREWRPDLERFGAGELNERFRRHAGRDMTADAWCGWVAVKAIAEAALHAESIAPADVADALRVLRFDGHKGEPLYFDDEQRLVQPLYD
jgi:hypothetical protein